MTSRSPLMYDRELRCPRDGDRMEKVVLLTGVTYDRCGRCAGLWFDATELQRVSGDRELEAMAARTVPVAEKSSFGCMRCWGDCFQTKVGRITVDTCSSCHGVWMDGGELESALVEVEELREARAAMSPLQRLLMRLR